MAPTRAPASREVTVAAANLRNGPGTLYDVITKLREGDALRYLDTRDGWVRVETGAGRRGWVEGSLLHLLDEQTGATYQASPEAWRLTAPDGAEARVAGITLAAAETPGLLTLTVTGAGLDRALVSTGPAGLSIDLDGAPGWTGRFKVAAAGITEVTLTAHGIAVHPQGAAPNVTLLVQTPDRLVLQLHPRIDTVLRYLQNGAVVCHIGLAGSTTPLTRTSNGGHAVSVALPGALLGETELPDGVTAAQTADGVTLTVATDRPYALRQTRFGLDLLLYTPDLAGKVIVLDPGHGGSETGAVSPYTGMAEKDVNLDVALRLQPLLEAKGARVVLTRTTDAHAIAQTAWDTVDPADNPVRADLHERVRIAEAAGADLLLSIHHNAGEGSGAEVYYAWENLNRDRSRLLAAMLQAAFVDNLGRYDRGFGPEVFYVNRFATMPSVLTEGGFMTDPVESWLLADPDYRQRMAEEMAAMLDRYYQGR
jgi:N-acetylmuramoyl-L-alanine amidase